jgi:hypothetical protein
MGKKAFFMGFFTDVIAWFILFLGVMFWAVIFFISSSQASYQLKEESAFLANEGILVNYLDTPAGNGNIADMIIEVYQGKDTAALTRELDSLLNKVYEPEEVCWKLWYYRDDEKILLDGTECGKTDNIFDAETVIPTPAGENLKIKLNIPGYKK